MKRQRVESLKVSKRTLLFMVLASFTSLLAAEGVLEVLQATYRIESRLFDAELARYNEARRGEAEAHRTLRSRSDQLDRALRNRSSRMDQLEQLEAEVTQARELAYAASRELAEQRRQLYRRMTTLAQLEIEIDDEEGRQLIPPSRLDGFWELEFSPTGEVGLLRLRVEGTLITGTYRLSGPRTGSVRGTLADNEVDLERIDNANGFDSVLEGTFNPGTRQITGRWTAVDLSGGRQGGGTFKARKLSPVEEENLDTRTIP